MNITVYLGANIGKDISLKENAEKLGSWIGENDHTLVYGGSKSGLMGVLASSVLEHSGKVIGVEPKFFVDEGFVYDKIDELIITDDIASRRKKMIELGDCFIAFPGGTGTLEEISEVMSMVALKHSSAPCIIFNLNSYYDDLKRLLDKMVSMELSSYDRLSGIFFANSLEEIYEIISRY